MKPSKRAIPPPRDAANRPTVEALTQAVNELSGTIGDEEQRAARIGELVAAGILRHQPDGSYAAVSVASAAGTTAPEDMPVSTAQAAALALKVNKSGDTMTGALLLPEFRWTGAAGSAMPADDVSTITRPGFWRAEPTSANKPAGASSYGAIVAANYVSNTRAQMYLEATPGAVNNLWIRHTNAYTDEGTSFEPWNKVWHDGNFDPATKLGVSAKAADSELLDGMDSSRFVSGSNSMKTSTYPADLNTSMPSGFYEQSAPVAATSANGVSTWNWMINVRHSNENPTGGLYGWQMSNIIGTNEFYVRGANAGTWGAWDKIVTSMPDGRVWMGGRVGVNNYERLAVGGGILSSGANAGLIVMARDNAALTYSWYATGGEYRLYKDGYGTALTMDAALNLIVVGNTKSANLNAGKWAGSAEYGGIFHSQMAAGEYMIINGGTADNSTYISTVASGTGNVNLRPNGNVPTYETKFTNAGIQTETNYGRRNASGGGLNTLPRIFVQSGDPGAAAADGDLWFW